MSAATALRNAEPWHIHLADEQTEVERQISLMGELDVAIDLGELEVVYQPKLDLKTDRITSVEALVRWNHPQRGPLRPDLFIPMAEDANRICDLTLYVLQRTIDDLAAWCQHGLVVSAAVNISAKLVYSNEFIDKAKRILAETGIPRNRLIFEVTESATIDDPSAAVAALQHFRDLGIAISMDDYGTGQSTLTYLKQLPLSELKIDRSFVQHAHEDANDALLVQSTIDLAHRLGLRVVAEGVEDRSCLTFLREAGCDLAQGYFIGRPTSPEEIREMLTSHTSLAA
ncbi:MAG TPA: EAL domain-containing protein [Candidatus Melainabacteria bacterium]|nr:EAL domain-containing protein [Candidatus Melainabacteria bacterium]